MSNLLAFELGPVFFQNAAVGKVDSLYSLISQMLPTAYVIAGVILFIYIVAGGFMIITSAGNPDAAKEGQKIITNAIIGFVILFLSYWIIQLVGFITGIQIFAPKNTGL